jgi:hypothetical protein
LLANPGISRLQIAVLDALNPRRLALGAVKRLLLPPEPAAEDVVGKPRVRQEPAPASTETDAMPRSRDRILANLDDMYRDAFEAAKASEDESQMRSLDFAYRREQLYFEILLDIRDAMTRRHD